EVRRDRVGDLLVDRQDRVVGELEAELVGERPADLVRPAEPEPHDRLADPLGPAVDRDAGVQRLLQLPGGDEPGVDQQVAETPTGGALSGLDATPALGVAHGPSTERSGVRSSSRRDSTSPAPPRRRTLPSAPARRASRYSSALPSESRIITGRSGVTARERSSLVTA